MRTQQGRQPPFLKTVAGLMQKELPEPKYAVPGLLPEGLTMLAGSPKTGKSWLALQLATAVATGGVALGCIPVERGAVALFALEDNENRLQRRVLDLGLTEGQGENLYYANELSPLDSGGLEVLEEYMENYPDLRLVVIDTLARVRRATRSKGNIYQEDVDSLAGLHALGQKYHVAILLVHHLNKGKHDDVFNSINGSTGLFGVVDSAWVLQHKRNHDRAQLSVTGRDVEEQELALSFDKSTCTWSLLGDASKFLVTPERQALFDVLSSRAEPMAPSKIAEALGKSPGATKQMLRRATSQGQLINQGGKYVLSNH